MGLNTLVRTDADPDTVAGGPKLPFCSEAWDAVARYLYAGLQGGSIMEGWMREENTMIACCSDGTRPVIFKIERVDAPSRRPPDRPEHAKGQPFLQNGCPGDGATGRNPHPSGG